MHANRPSQAFLPITVSNSLTKSGVPSPVTCSRCQHLNPARVLRGTHRVPALRRRETIRSTSRVAALCDIVERCRAGRVQERVQEPERLAPGADDGVVEERDEPGDGRARCARAGDGDGLAATHDLEGPRLGGDVGEGAAGGVEEPFVRVPELVEVSPDRVVLVRRPRKEVREAARGEVDCYFGTEARRAADGCEAGVGTCEEESWERE